MTTIHAVGDAGDYPLHIEPDENGCIDIDGYEYEVADLLAALDAVPRSQCEERTVDAVARAFRKRAEAAEAKLFELDLNPWKARAQDALEKLAEAQARVDRVSEALSDIEYDTDCEDVVSIVRTIRAALADPEPPFALPTEAGAGIVATYKQTGEDKELRLFKDGKWRSSSGRTYTPERVMDFFGGHRLIEDGEA
jgi:hypothetical protein